MKEWNTNLVSIEYEREKEWVKRKKERNEGERVRDRWWGRDLERMKLANDRDRKIELIGKKTSEPKWRRERVKEKEVERT